VRNAGTRSLRNIFISRPRKKTIFSRTCSNSIWYTRMTKKYWANMNLIYIAQCQKYLNKWEQEVQPNTTASRSKGRRVLDRSDTKIPVANLARGTDVYLLSLYWIIQFRQRPFAMGRFPVQGSYQMRKMINCLKVNFKSRQARGQKAC